MAQALWLLLGPVLPGTSDSAAQFVLSLAVVAAALLVVVAAAGVSLPSSRTVGVASCLRTRAVARPPRLSDPDAAGRPRPRAPTEYPAAARCR
ncbi:DUF6412 domain-containing protein [Actinoplanes sp. NPDC051470]|uniref:DUF6412 domain-containing protein n=1 Tax=unclassified Actinoplanes TaxID=2626549 RepID=UPI003429C1A4